MSTIIGAQLDNYRIVEKIGEGGMGSVYRAVDVMLERDVALKFLRPELSREPELVQRFRHEAVLLARLNHQYIAPIFGLHRYGEELFIAMEYVPGETLEARLKRIERLPADSALHVTSMVLQALDYAHRLGVVHRDIKPANVIMTPGGIVKVMDFGIARVLGDERRTRAGSIVGTIAYMAPEQIQGGDADHRADLYAVGILLYEMLSGHAPFQADTDWALMQAQIGQPPGPLRGQVDVPEAVEAAALRALEKTPDRRFQSATEFQQALELAVRELAPGSVPLPGVTGSFFAAPRATAVPTSGLDETRVGLPTPPPGSPFATAPPVPAATPIPTPLMSPSTAQGVPAAKGVDETRLVSAVPGPPVLPPTTMPPAAPADPATPDLAAPQPPPAPLAKPAPAPAVAAKVKLPGQKPKTSGLGLALGAGALMLVLVGGAVAWVMSQRGATEIPPPGSEVSAQPAAASPPPVQPADAAASPPASATTGTAKPSTTAPAVAAGTNRPRPPATPRDAVPPPGPVAAGTPAPEPEPPAVTAVRPPTPPATALTDAVFKNLRLVRRNGPEIDVELHFGPVQASVTNVGGRNTFGALPYNQISAEYYESRHTRVFVRTVRYWLRVQGLGGAGFLLRAERDAVQGIVTEFEKRSGKKVVTGAAQEETDQSQ